MKMTAGRTFLLWLLAMLAGAAIVWNTRFTADMSFFLPSHPTAEQQVLVDQLKEGVVSRLLMLAIEGGDAEQRAAISRDLRGRLAKMPEFVSVQNGEAGSQDADRAFLFKHRYLLSPAISQERFTVAGLQASIANSIDLLASPAGMMLKPMLARDPTGELIEMLSDLNAGAQPNSRNGVWASRDGERAMLLTQTTALGSDTDGQENAISLIRSEFAAGSPGGTLKIQISGPGVFAVTSRASIKREVSRLSAISTLAIIAVLFFVYRSARLMTLANSAALNTTGTKIVDLRTAVSRVGFNIVRSAGLSYAVGQLKLAKEFRTLDKPLDALWRRSVVVASIAHVIAKRFTTLNAEAALLSGLLSCVGRVYILTRTVRHPELFADQLAYQSLVREWHANVAKAILENWNLPDAIVSAVSEHEDPEREQRGVITLTDVLAVASLLANFSGENDIAQCAAPLLKPMKRMQLELDQCTQVLKESAEEVAALQATLGVA